MPCDTDVSVHHLVAAGGLKFSCAPVAEAYGVQKSLVIIRQ